MNTMTHIQHERHHTFRRVLWLVFVGSQIVIGIMALMAVAMAFGVAAGLHTIPPT